MGLSVMPACHSLETYYFMSQFGQLESRRAPSTAETRFARRRLGISVLQETACPQVSY